MSFAILVRRKVETSCGFFWLFLNRQSCDFSSRHLISPTESAPSPHLVFKPSAKLFHVMEFVLGNRHVLNSAKSESYRRKLHRTDRQLFLANCSSVLTRETACTADWDTTESSLFSELFFVAFVQRKLEGKPQTIWEISCFSVLTRNPRFLHQHNHKNCTPLRFQWCRNRRVMTLAQIQFNLGKHFGN